MRFASRGSVCALMAILLQSLTWAQIFTKTDPASEVALGRQVAAEIERHYGRTVDPTLEHRVNRVGLRLAEQLDEKLYTYEFRVFKSEEINACALPGGIIFISEGLLAHVPNDDALAFIVGHEIGHASQRHWKTLVKKGERLGLLMKVISGVASGYGARVGQRAGGYQGADIGALLGSLVVSLAHELIDSSYSREMEDNADAAGILLMWRAHFDTEGAIQAMEMLGKLTDRPKVPKYLRSHPPLEARIAHLKKMQHELANQAPPPLKPMDRPDDNPEDLTAFMGDLTGIDPVANPWYPLAPGNVWTYEVAQTGGQRTTYTLRVVSASPAKTGAVYRIEWSTGKGNRVISQVLTTSSACWRRPRPEEAESPWIIDFLLPPVPDTPVMGGEWTYWGLGNESITVPCGRFDASVVRKQGGNPQRTYKLWFVNGVGLVKRLWEEENVTEVLVSYQVSSPPTVLIENGPSTGLASP